jgi:hypothetical protein
VSGTRRAITRGLAAGLLGVGLALAPGVATAPADAACVAPITVPQALNTGDTVFVGTVTQVLNDGTEAVVRVDERWHGADRLASSVHVLTAPDPDGTGGRKYTKGPWLFDAIENGPYLEDHACSATKAWTEGLARYRPPGVKPADHTVTSSPLDALDVFESDVVVPVAALVGALLIAVLAYILVLRRRRRPPDWMR